MSGSALTAPVREKDRRIEALEDVVRDLLVHVRKPGEPCVCGGDRLHMITYYLGLRYESRTAHEVDCPVKRADFLLRGGAL